MRTTFPVPARAAVLAAALAAVAAGGCSDVGTARAAADEAPRCPLVINEIAAAGEPADWFELVNVSSAPVDLAGYRFADGTPGLDRTARLPPSVLAPGARHVEEVTTGGDGFRLGADDALVLYRDRAGELEPCDRVRWTDDDAPPRGSYARLPDGNGRFETVLRDSRGVMNR